MKKAYYYKLLFASVCCMLFVGHITAQEKVEKTQTYSFSMEPTGSFVIDNKYGNIEIEGWDEPRIAIELNVSVQHKDKDKAYNLMDRIEATVLEGANFINITSTIRQKRSSFFNDLLSDLKDELKFEVNKADVDIDYVIKLPKELKIDVTNSFGDVFIDNCIGFLNAKVSHGTLRINSELAGADIDLKYAKLNVRELPDSELIMNNSEAYITNGADLILESSGSELEIETMDNLQMVGSRDKARIGTINSISGNVKYTSIQIRNLAEAMNLTMQLGDLRCDKIDGQESKIRIEQRSSDIDINMADAAFVLEATMQGGTLRLPESAENISQEYIDEEKNHRTVRASFGNVTIGTMIIRGVKGTVVLRDF